MKRIRQICIGGLVTLGMGLSALAVNAQDKDKKPPLKGPNAERGVALAKQLCSNCHIVSPDQTSSAGAGIPSFRAIANRPEQTSAHVVNVLIKPHAPMPNMQLSRFEILDIIAYLDQLRRSDAGPPLLKQRKGDGKLKFPQPS